MKKTLLNGLKLGIPAGLFAYLLWSVDPADYQAFWQQPKRWWLLLLSQFVTLLAIVLSFQRWRILVLAFDIPFSLKECLRLGFLGHLLNFVSFGSIGGDLFKAILVARNKPEKRPEAVASVLVDRAIGLLGLVLLAWVGLAFLSKNQFPNGLPPLLVGIRRGAGFIAVAATVSLLMAVYAGAWFERLIAWIGTWPFAGPSLARMAQALRLLRKRPATIPVMVGLSILIQALITLAVYMISHGVYSSAPDLYEHLIVVPPGMAAGALPLAPGGIGLQEGAMVGLFKQLTDLPDNFSGMLVATMYRLTTIAIAGIGLGYYIASHGREFRFVRQADSVTGS